MGIIVPLNYAELWHTKGDPRGTVSTLTTPIATSTIKGKLDMI